MFEKSTVNHYNFAVFFLQLLASGILEIQLRQRDVLIELARDEADNYFYDNSLIWERCQFRLKNVDLLPTLPSFFLTKVLRDKRPGANGNATTGPAGNEKNS